MPCRPAGEFLFSGVAVGRRVLTFRGAGLAIRRNAQRTLLRRIVNLR
jgi:hypothetical protein